MRRTFLWLCFILFAWTSYAQEQDTVFTYPDLIPVLKGGVFGYCDSNFNMVIAPEYYQADFFQVDLAFQVYNVKDPEIVKYGRADYAWVETGDNQRYRIDKAGNRVYHYKASDFKEHANYIELNTYEGFTITGLDSTTLVQLVNGNQRVDDTTFALFQTKLKAIAHPEDGLFIRCFPATRAFLPYTYFRDPQTQLEGIKDGDTGAIIIPAKYTMLTKLFGDSMQYTWFPFYWAVSAAENASYYVGLDGKEYIVRRPGDK